MSTPLRVANNVRGIIGPYHLDLFMLSGQSDTRASEQGPNLQASSKDNLRSSA